MQQMIDIFLVNGDRLFRESLGALMASWPGYELAGEAATVSEARAALVRHQVDVVLVDIDLPGESGFPLLQHLTRDHHGMHPVVLTRALHADYAREAIRLGARGYLSHDISPERLREALRLVCDGGTAFDPRVCRLLAADPVHERITDRECQVLALVGEGACNVEIARRLGVTEKTVKSHVSRLLGKLSVSSRVHLALYAQATSLLDPPFATSPGRRTG
jgi:two-component system, NarL family, response regulator LiaR